MGQFMEIVEWLDRTHTTGLLLKRLSLFAQQGMGTQLSSELGKMKAVRKRSGTPPNLFPFSVQVGSPMAMVSLSRNRDIGIAEKLNSWSTCIKMKISGKPSHAEHSV